VGVSHHGDRLPREHELTNLDVDLVHARQEQIVAVAFKKDGGSIDPDPWWAKGSSEKVRG
jgi:hypothetical protein